MRTHGVLYIRLLEHADCRCRFNHGKTKDGPVLPEEFTRATIRAEFTFPMDEHAYQNVRRDTA
jgi:hypothetical protein